MSTKAKSITEMITELQEENVRLQNLGKLFDRAVRDEFGYSIKELHDLIRKEQILEKKLAASQKAGVGLSDASSAPQKDIGFPDTTETLQ